MDRERSMSMTSTLSKRSSASLLFLLRRRLVISLGRKTSGVAPLPRGDDERETGFGLIFSSARMPSLGPAVVVANPTIAAREREVLEKRKIISGGLGWGGVVIERNDTIKTRNSDVKSVFCGARVCPEKTEKRALGNRKFRGVS